MSESALSVLRRLLVDDYNGLKERLARRFGSIDFASEVLHEAWLRLDRGEAGVLTAVLHNPKAYLYRVALNIAADRQRAERTRLSSARIEAIHRHARDDLDPGRIAEARLELQALAKAINELPPRRRAVLIAARVEGLPYKEIAARLGVTVRVVDRELSLALDHLGEGLEKKSSAQGGKGMPNPSKK